MIFRKTTADINGIHLDATQRVQNKSTLKNTIVVLFFQLFNDYRSLKHVLNKQQKTETLSNALSQTKPLKTTIAPSREQRDQLTINETSAEAHPK